MYLISVALKKVATEMSLYVLAYNLGCSDFFVGKETHSRRFGKNSVIPAKAGGRPAGIYRESARATSLWIPAFAGMTEGCANAGLMSLPTKYSDEPKIIALEHWILHDEGSRKPSGDWRC